MEEDADQGVDSGRSNGVKQRIFDKERNIGVGDSSGNLAKQGGLAAVPPPPPGYIPPREKKRSKKLGEDGKAVSSESISAAPQEGDRRDQ